MMNILCEGETPAYIFYATDIPSYIYYIFLPSIIITFLLGLFVFLKNKKENSSKIFFLLTFSMAIWMITMLGNWAQNDSRLSVLFDEFNVLVAIISAIFIYFVLLVFYKEKINLSKNILIFGPILPILFFLSSNINVKSIELGWCETTSGKLYWYLSFLLIAYALSALFLLTKKIKESENKIQRNQVLLVLAGFLIWTIISVVMGVLLPIVGYPTSTLWAPVSCTIFAFFITISIVKYKFLNIKTIAAQILVVVTWILIASQFFFIRNNTNRILTGITLALALGFGWMLIRAIKNEIRRKVKKMYTDPKHLRVEDPGSTKGNPVFEYLDAFDPDKKGVKAMKRHYRRGGLGDSVVKKHLMEILLAKLDPIRAKRKEFSSEKDYVMQLLKKGTEDARAVAAQTLSEVRKAMGINYFN